MSELDQLRGELAEAEETILKLREELSDLTAIKEGLEVACGGTESHEEESDFSLDF